jgi:hydroxyethylthiazole kinase
MHAPLSDLPRNAASVLARLRQRRPRVHCITNTVAQAFTANALLAVGATPSMTISPEEIAGFVARADALLVNLGTFDAERRAAVDVAVEQADDSKIPWLLDPVLIDRSPPRADYARFLVSCRPAAIRLNEAEFATLSGKAADRKGLADYAAANRTVIGLTGARDVISEGKRQITIENGHPLMALVTAMGCAASALAAAALNVEDDPLLAVGSALLVLGVAGEIAGERARGPGSFAIEILDALHGLDQAALSARAKVS